MGKRISIIVLGLILTLALVFGGWGCAEKPPAEAIKWRFQTTMPVGAYVQDFFAAKFHELVNERGQGRLEMEMFPRDAIVTRKEGFDAVQRGIVEVLNSPPSTYVGVFPEGNVEFGLPMAFPSLDVGYDFFYKYKNGAFFKMMDEAYREKGLHLLSDAPYNNGFLTKFPLNKAEDVKGKKIRVIGLPLLVVKNLGGLPVSLTIAETYTALQRGTVDGTVSPIYFMTTQSFHEVTDYLILPPISVNFTNLFVNLDAYNKLPKDLQKMVDEAAIEAAYYYKDQYVVAEAKVVEEAKKQGVTVITLPAAEIAKIREAALPTWDEAAAKCPRCATLVDMVKSYLKEKGL